jgi:hypothetical protein
MTVGQKSIPSNHDKSEGEARIVPRWSLGTTVVEPPEAGSGWWAGGPSAIYHEGVIYLAYRLRRPVAEGRGYVNVIAKSTDGVKFEIVVTIPASSFGAESLERPALVVTKEGQWRLYVSCATPGTKHWRVDLLQADSLEALGQAKPQTVLPGDETIGVKDPVVVWTHGRWHLWASCHPLDVVGQEDRMVTNYAISNDGVKWEWVGTVLAGRPGTWDARGTRITSVMLDGETAMAFYDGRANAEENWYERTGVAKATLSLDKAGKGLVGQFVADGEEPAAISPHGHGTLRYVSSVNVSGQGLRLYYEAAKPDGSNDLRTELILDSVREPAASAA